jgi:hypothetical protein
METQIIDDDKQYRVELNARIELFGNVLVPGQEVVLRGDQVKEFAASISSAELVDG